MTGGTGPGPAGRGGARGGAGGSGADGGLDGVQLFDDLCVCVCACVCVCVCVCLMTMTMTSISQTPLSSDPSLPPSLSFRRSRSLSLFPPPLPSFTHPPPTHTPAAPPPGQSLVPSVSLSLSRLQGHLSSPRSLSLSLSLASRAISRPLGLSLSLSRLQGYLSSPPGEALESIPNPARISRNPALPRVPERGEGGRARMFGTRPPSPPRARDHEKIRTSLPPNA